jgi:hypothetical protein
MQDWFKENKIHSFMHALQEEKNTNLSINAWFDKNSCDFILGWRSKIPRSNVTCGQTSRSQMSLVVKCHLRSNVTVVKCNKILKWSKVPWSNETVVIGDPLTKSNRLSIFLSVLFSEHQKVGIGEARAHPTPLYLKIPYSCCIQFWNFLAKGHSK